MEHLSELRDGDLIQHVVFLGSNYGSLIYNGCLKFAVTF